MTTAYPETLTFPSGLATAPHLSALIDETIKRFTEEWQLFRLPVALQFPEELEAVYEAETRQARVRELRFTVSSAIGFMCVLTATDEALVPDLGWLGLESRLVAGLVFALAVAAFGRVSASVREGLLFWSAYFAVVVIAAIPVLSHAPTAPYGLFIGTLAITYGNTTFPLRFPYAWRCDLLCLGTIAVFIHADPRIGAGLGGALMFMGVVGASFTLIANYRMERSARLGYLLASKEALRLFALSRDRDALTAISNTDALTGLANRGHFDRYIATLFDGQDDRGKSIALMMLDVDFFKRYNDRYGHPAGDACLRSVAKALLRSMRSESDFVFRYGGEEFGVLLLGAPRDEAQRVAERIRNAVQQEAIPHANRQDSLSVVTVSIGVGYAVLGDGTTAEKLLETADTSLYAAKHAGRNRVAG